jgi:2-hydroxychromene-2-carboxylate isomerase
MEFREVVVYAVFDALALVVIFWIMYLGHGQIGSLNQEAMDVDETEPGAPLSSSFRFEHPDTVTEVIGSYMGTQIYRYAVIHGVEYQFDHIFPLKGKMQEDRRACCLAPGLIYLPVLHPKE